MKQVILLLLVLLPVLLFAQNPVTDSLRIDSLTTDSLLQPLSTDTTHKDSLAFRKDTTVSVHNAETKEDSYSPLMQRALQRSLLLNHTGTPAAALIQPRQHRPQDIYFYSLLDIVLFLGFLRYFYNRYFNNLFQVFFNTSLRQGQLTDQLLQARQASLFYNMLFALTGGLYIYFLILFYGKSVGKSPAFEMTICVVGLAVLYMLKYVSLKITGWLTGNRPAANTYLFIIFLINKILSILLLPFVIVIALGAPLLQYPAVVLSLLLIALMFFLRFVRSYVVLQRQIKVSRLHFMMYIIGVELLPLLLIYKGLMILLNKNL